MQGRPPQKTMALLYYFYSAQYIWIFLVPCPFAAKIPIYRYWISLDFLGFSRPNRDLSMTYAAYSDKNFSCRFFPVERRRNGSPRACGRAELLIGQSYFGFRFLAIDCCPSVSSAASVEVAFHGLATAQVGDSSVAGNSDRLRTGESRQGRTSTGKSGVDA